jgi:hypothetical protein
MDAKVATSGLQGTTAQGIFSAEGSGSAIVRWSPRPSDRTWSAHAGSIGVAELGWLAPQSNECFGLPTGVFRSYPSFSEMRRDVLSGPAMTRAIASSMPITCRLARAARMVASLIRFSRSARRSLASGAPARPDRRLPTACCGRARPGSGVGRQCRGDRASRGSRSDRGGAAPGRGTSGRLVAAITITCVLVSGWRPTASISSTKTMQGLFFLALSKRSRTRLAPTPTNISTNSKPEMLKNGTPTSPATALLSSVLPVPGGRPPPLAPASLRQRPLRRQR